MSLQSEQPSGSQLTPPRQSELPVIPEELPPAAWSLDEVMEQGPVLPSNSKLLFGTMPTLELIDPSWGQVVERRRSSAEATFTPTAAGLRSDQGSFDQLPSNMSTHKNTILSG